MKPNTCLVWSAKCRKSRKTREQCLAYTCHDPIHFNVRFSIRNPNGDARYRWANNIHHREREREREHVRISCWSRLLPVNQSTGNDYAFLQQRPLKVGLRRGCAKEGIYLFQLNRECSRTAFSASANAAKIIMSFINICGRAWLYVFST